MGHFWVGGRALAAHGRDPKSTAAIRNTKNVLEEAQLIGMWPAIPALRHALCGDTEPG